MVFSGFIRFFFFIFLFVHSFSPVIQVLWCSCVGSSLITMTNECVWTISKEWCVHSPESVIRLWRRRKGEQKGEEGKEFAGNLER